MSNNGPIVFIEYLDKAECFFYGNEMDLDDK